MNHPCLHSKFSDASFSTCQEHRAVVTSTKGLRQVSTTWHCTYPTSVAYCEDVAKCCKSNPRNKKPIACQRIVAFELARFAMVDTCWRDCDVFSEEISRAMPKLAVIWHVAKIDPGKARLNSSLGACPTSLCLSLNAQTPSFQRCSHLQDVQVIDGICPLLTDAQHDLRLCSCEIKKPQRESPETQGKCLPLPSRT